MPILWLLESCNMRTYVVCSNHILPNSRGELQTTFWNNSLVQQPHTKMHNNGAAFWTAAAQVTLDCPPITWAYIVFLRKLVHSRWKLHDMCFVYRTRQNKTLTFSHYILRVYVEYVQSLNNTHWSIVDNNIY